MLGLSVDGLKPRAGTRFFLFVTTGKSPRFRPVKPTRYSIGVKRRRFA
jgi:hypothetical protein